MSSRMTIDEQAVRLAVRESRNERVRRRGVEQDMREGDAKLQAALTKLAEAQAATEATLQAFIQYSMGRGNGTP